MTTSLLLSTKSRLTERKLSFSSIPNWLVLNVRNPISRGMIARTHRLLRMEFPQLIFCVWYGMSIVHVYSTCGNSSTHFPFNSSSLFFNPLTMTLLIVSACPFPYGEARVEYLFLMPSSPQYLLKALLLN